MKKMLPLAAVAALLTLSACGSDEPEVIDRQPQDPLAGQLDNAAPVVLPPSVKESKSYRCDDGSLLFVDFMSDDLSATVKTGKEGGASMLKKAAPDKPYTADGGYYLSGDEDTVTATVPGKGPQSCKA